MGTPGYADVVIGTQYGDEGKARVVDDLAKNYGIIVRFNGGANAGHTVKAEGVTVALKQVPSGVFYPEVLLYIGSGCVVNPEFLRGELARLQDMKIDVLGRLRISCQAGVVQPHHMLLDALIGGEVGTTKNGIGPAYADRALRMWGDRLLNVRMGDLVDSPDEAFSAMRRNFECASEMYDFGSYGIDAELETMKRALEVIAPLVERSPLFLQEQLQSGKNVLFEGAQSFMLDVNKGSVPYVTSSGTGAASAYVGGDLAPGFHRKTVGIVKAIMSRVGHGPFASEFGGRESEQYCMAAVDGGGPQYGKTVEAGYDHEDLLRSEDLFEMSKALRYYSGEYGTVTARPRRVGALDLVQLKYAVAANGIDELVITKCDLLNLYARTSLLGIPLVTAYEFDGERIDFVPGTTSAYARVKPVFEYMPSFSEDVSRMRSFSELPGALREFVERIEHATLCKVVGLGVGPDREQYVVR